jgi:F0F1-type ATP synthase delta subunit
MAQMNEIVPAISKLAWKANTNKFATPKSTNAPTAPTIANLMKRVRSRVSCKIEIWVTITPTAV